eukprot:c1004_g1_i1.p1 GENE.c1004_g1_i1~~c1004_g1_i1.p1  ORF type:complete len:338 (+),score=103.16 c1004_g1_i1:203-1216(+)
MSTSPNLTSKHGRRLSSKSFLQTLTMGDFISWRAESTNQEENKQVVYIESNKTVAEAMHLLHQHNILSVPVWDSEKKEFIWFLSIVDILRFAMVDADHNPKLLNELFNYKLNELIAGLDDEAGLVQCVPKRTQVTSVMEWFSLGVHRVLVQDDDTPPGVPLGFIVSQSDVIRYLEAHEGGTGEIGEKTVHEHGFMDPDVPSIGPSALVTIRETASALEGFRILFAKRANAAAVVDENGQLVENLSVSDLRGVLASNIGELLALPVPRFLETRRGKRTPIVCSPQTPLKQVVRTLASSRVHRLWIVDGGNRAIGVVSLTDVLCKFAPFDYKLLNSTKI